MKRPLLETEKNLLVCAILMIIAGIGLILMGKNNFGVGCVVVGVAFTVWAIISYVKDDDNKTNKG